MIIDCITDIESIDLDGCSFVLVKIGSDSSPATTEDIRDIQKLITDLKLEQKVKFLITHHNVDFKVYTCDKN